MDIACILTSIPEFSVGDVGFVAWGDVVVVASNNSLYFPIGVDFVAWVMWWLLLRIRIGIAVGEKSIAPSSNRTSPDQNRPKFSSFRYCKYRQLGTPGRNLHRPPTTTPDRRFLQ